jgi:anti-anti-sigma factor
MSNTEPQDAFTISATPALESIAVGLEEQAAELIFDPIRHDAEPLIVFDLSQIDYFGSVFLGVLLRCWKLVQARGGTMALSGVSDRAKELLHLTSLDFVWPIYANRREAVEALLSD